MFSFSVLMVNAELSLTTTAIKNYKDQWYIVSDNVTTYWECSNMVKKYNTEYPSYKRSECFKDGEWYKYFICQTSQSCEVAGGTQSSSSSSSSSSTLTISTQAGVVSGENSSSSSSTTTSAVVPNKEKLDKFVTKIESLKSTMTDEKFEATLTAVLAKLEKLSTKYSSNTTIAPMLAYLKTSIAELKNKATQDKDVDNFFCELTDSCDNSSSQSSNITWWVQTGATWSINTTEEIINLYVSWWILACWNPEKNNYTTYWAEKWVVKIQRWYCEEKWGYVWTMCSWKATNVKTLKSIKNNDTFVCSNTQVQISTGSQIWTWITSSTISNSNDNKYLLYSNLSVVGSSIDFWVIDWGILPIWMNKEYSTEKKVITLKNVQKSDNPKLSSKNIVVTLASADQYWRLKEITLPNIKINNECSGKEIISWQTCNVEVTFIATDKFYSISEYMALIISWDTLFE